MEVELLVEELKEESEKSGITLEDRLFLIQILHAYHHFINKRIERVSLLNNSQLKDYLGFSNQQLQSLAKVDLNKISSPEIAESVHTLAHLLKTLRGKVRSQLESPIRQTITGLAPSALNNSL